MATILRKRYRKPEVCKPCWELHYCPYGVLVESMPFCDPPEYRQRGGHETQAQMYERAKRDLTSTKPSNDDELWQNMFFVMYADPEKKKLVQQFDPRDVRCTIFGHTCPVFAHGYVGVTETRQRRRVSRNIPYDIMFKVARRDDYRCQRCLNPVPDDQMEFDHVIPHSKGGPTTVSNIRLLCRTCNRRKGNSLSELLDPEQKI
jgi:HNH endonuclease